MPRLNNNSTGEAFEYNIKTMEVKGGNGLKSGFVVKKINRSK